MIPKNFSSEGFVIARKNYSESDRILTLFTKNYGKTSLLAKGVRRTDSRKRGSVEIFSYIRFSGVKTKGLDLVTEVEAIDTYSDLRKDLRKVAVAYFFMETIVKITRDGEPNYELFNTLKRYLSRLKEKAPLKEIRKNFVYEVLVIQGFWPKGKTLLDPDHVLEEVTERKISSRRVGKKILI